MSHKQPKTKKRYRTLAVGEDGQDGGLPSGIGVKTITPGEPAADQGPRPRRRNRDNPDEGGQDRGQ